MHTHAAIASQIEAKPAANTEGVAVRGLCSVWTPRAETARNAPLVQRVLAARGVLTGDAAEAFLNPKMAMLHDPSRMPGLDRAAQRILDAANTGQSIVIYGDYDVDGISASAILFHALRAIAPQARVQTYVPHRLEEGYGLNADSLQELIKQGADLIISVDCGDATGQRPHHHRSPQPARRRQPGPPRCVRPRASSPAGQRVPIR